MYPAVGPVKVADWVTKTMVTSDGAEVKVEEDKKEVSVACKVVDDVAAAGSVD